MRRIGMLAATLGLALLLGACATRSISDSGYHGGDGHGYAYHDGGNPLYKGELTEFDVLGIDVARPASDEEIAQQLEKRQKVGLRKGGLMMVIGTVIVMWPNVRERAAIATALSRSSTGARELADVAPGG